MSAIHLTLALSPSHKCLICSNLLLQIIFANFHCFPSHFCCYFPFNSPPLLFQFFSQHVFLLSISLYLYFLSFLSLYSPFDSLFWLLFFIPCSYFTVCNPYSPFRGFATSYPPLFISFQLKLETNMQDCANTTASLFWAPFIFQGIPRFLPEPSLSSQVTIPTTVINKNT